VTRGSRPLASRDKAARLHRQAIVIDMVCPLLAQERYLDDWIAGGATCVGPTVASDHTLLQTMANLATWFERLRRLSGKILHVTRVEDIRRAKREGKLGVIFHFQNTQPFERSADLVEVYYRLGVRMVQLTYNLKNWIGDGCDERTDAGLSEFGRQVIREMNRVGMVVDLPHTGYRTTMEAMEASEAPVVFSHSGVKSVCDSPRNLRDDQIQAVAASGGVIGLNAFPAFVSRRRWPTLDDLVRHADHIAERVGVDHLSVGLDFYQGQWPFASPAQAKAMYAEALRTGRWRPGTYPAPPYRYARGVEVPSKLGNLTAALIDRGYRERDVRKILGENLIRVFSRVWK
jgi:membrane dipeptidase